MGIKQPPEPLCRENYKFSSHREGDCRAFSFYTVEATLAWIHGLPPSAMCLHPTGYKGSVARNGFRSRLRFPYQILCAAPGKDGAEVFCFESLCGDGPLMSLPCFAEAPSEAVAEVEGPRPSVARQLLVATVSLDSL